MTAPPRRPLWYAAASSLRAGRPLAAREKAALRRRGMLREEYGLTGRGEAAHLAATLGLPVLEARILAALYAFRMRLEPGHPAGSATGAAPRAAAAPAAPAAAAASLPALPPCVPVSYSALLPLLAGRSQSRLRSAVARLVGRGLAAKRGREQVSIAEDALAGLSELGPQLLAVEALP